MKITKKLSTLVVSASILVATVGASLAGPIDSLSIKKDGIDLAPVEVIAVGGSFKKITTPSHEFSLTIHAKAKFGKKVKVAEVTTSSGPYLEADPGTWSIDYHPNKREFSKALSPNIAMSKITWSGGDPIKACNEKLKQSRNVLTQGATAQAFAYFQFHATNKTGQSGMYDGHHDSTWVWYPVVVKCMPSGVGGVKSN
ncbi:MAG: hypothetical protein ACOH2N_08840 [Devosia sp.]